MRRGLSRSGGTEQRRVDDWMQAVGERSRESTLGQRKTVRARVPGGQDVHRRPGLTGQSRKLHLVHLAGKVDVAEQVCDIVPAFEDPARPDPR